MNNNATAEDVLKSIAMSKNMETSNFELAYIDKYNFKRYIKAEETFFDMKNFGANILVY